MLAVVPGSKMTLCLPYLGVVAGCHKQKTLLGNTYAGLSKHWGGSSISILSIPLGGQVTLGHIIIMSPFRPSKTKELGLLTVCTDTFLLIPNSPLPPSACLSTAPTILMGVWVSLSSIKCLNNSFLVSFLAI